ncbi:MAG: 50S ribosomal protein L18 [Candidatus Pacearchaeota archaeon]
MRVIKKRRRRQRKTDYKHRLNLLKGGNVRVVIRKTNKYLIIQEIESKEAQDRVITSVSSKDLLKEGLNKKFSGSLKSIPACYLTGLLMAKKMKNKEINVVDLGMYRNHYGGRLYSAIKGLLDGGIKIKVDPKVFPKEERLEGKHLKEEVRKEFEKIKNKLL